MDNSDFEKTITKLGDASTDLWTAFYTAENDSVLAGMISEAAARIAYIKGFAQGQFNAQKEAEAKDANN